MLKTSKTNGTENKQAAVTLAKLNEQIATLQLQRAGLSDPLKLHYAELRKQLADTETQIHDLDPSWKPAPLTPRAVDKLRDIIAANGAPMTEAEILKAVGDLFTPWKTKNTLKKKSQGDKAVFAVKDGKYTVKAAA
jgi:hypothetical protein